MPDSESTRASALTDVMNPSKPTVLLVAEAVTLAHYARIATLARALPAKDYNVVVASDPRFSALDPLTGISFYPLTSISSRQFAHSLEQGKALYDRPTLIRYVETDLELLDHVKPDLVVGDFRLSLGVSAPLKGIPYASVVNAYWSPYAAIQYPVPDLPFTRVTGLRIGQWLFDRVRPLAFALHARPFHQTRRYFGLPALPGDVRNVYTWANHTLYADIPELVPMTHLPAQHHFIGPVLWSPDVLLPLWWATVPEGVPIIFVTLGSSGQASQLPHIVQVLAQLSVSVVVATGGKSRMKVTYPNVYVCDYFPISEAVKRAALIVCNGGSLTTYQALAEGVPVLGICTNMDQLLNMRALTIMGGAVGVRSAGLSHSLLTDVVTNLLSQSSLLLTHSLRRRIANYCSTTRFRQFIKSTCAGSPSEVLPLSR